jgi:hypothetical protein
VTFGGDNYAPIWSPDGARLAYARIEAEGRSLRAKAADNSGADTVLIAGIRASIAPVVWPRDDMIMYRSIAGMYQEILTLSLSRGAKPVRYHAGSDASLSPDGRHAAFTFLESTPTPQVLIRDFPSAVGQWKVSPHGGQRPRWSRDGRFVYYWTFSTPGFSSDVLQIDGGRAGGLAVGFDSLFRAQVDRTSTVAVRAPELVTILRTGGLASWDLHPDGKRFIVAIPEGEEPGGSGGARGTSRHVVTLNWFTELNELTKNRR